MVFNKFFIQISHYFRDRKISKFCKDNGIFNYNINYDGSVDINSDVVLTDVSDFNSKFKGRIPIKFGIVRGSFICLVNLNTFEGFPNHIALDLICTRDNNIWNFDHFPRSVGGKVDIRYSPILDVFKLFNDASKVELFQYYDIIRDKTIVLDRLNDFLKDIGMDRRFVYNKSYIHTLLQTRGYKIV